jgi:transposase
MTRRKFTSKFKFKVVFDALKERGSLAELAQKYKVSRQQISLWKLSFLSDGENVFSSKAKSKKTEIQDEKEKLLRIIGEQKVAMEFLEETLKSSH